MNFIDPEISEKAGPVGAGSGFAKVTKQKSDATKVGYSETEGERKLKALSFETPTGRITIGSRQDRRTLLALVEADTKGVTALEMSSWAYRLGAYVHRLRHDYGLAIETLRESHDGGWHGRYILHTPCRIVGIGDDG